MKLTRKNFIKGSAATLGVLAASSMVTSPASATTRPLYRDVPESIRLIVESARGILNGYPDGTFRPYQGISRIALIVAMHRMTSRLWGHQSDATMPDPTNITTDRHRPQAFADVPKSHPFYDYAQWAFYNNLLPATRTRVTNGRRYLNPEGLITRGEASYIMAMAMDSRVRTVNPLTVLPGYHHPLYQTRSFKDLKTTHPYYKTICWLTTTHMATGGGFNSQKGIDLGIAGSYPDGTFRPDAILDRHAVAVYWWRISGRLLQN